MDSYGQQIYPIYCRKVYLTFKIFCVKLNKNQWSNEMSLDRYFVPNAIVSSKLTYI